MKQPRTPIEATFRLCFFTWHDALRGTSWFNDLSRLLRCFPLNDGAARGAVLVGVALEALADAGVGDAVAPARALVVDGARRRVIVDHVALGACTFG